MKHPLVSGAVAVCALVLFAAACGGKSKKEMTGGAPQPGAAPGGGPNAAPPLVAPQPGVTTVCPTVSGEYRVIFKTSCGSTGWGWVDVAQNGCDITANLKQLALVKGRLEGDTATVALTFHNPCKGSGGGVLTVSGRVIAGTFSGGATGQEISCCGAMNGTFTLTKQ
jgi:hypothetical protein